MIAGKKASKRPGTARRESMDLSGLGKIMVIAGGLLALAGAGLWLAGKAGLPLGSLPGDLKLQRENVSVYFPIVTCIVVSVGLTLVLNLLGRFFR